ncbi:Oligopeptide transport ATP-binding protein OppD [bioreactor metagenome]|uniref:Oligopeptide transport ATP-binding protein OppD n=1 Tax=bioreactor metagenome TaxID=1076179 RepID=A0A644ZXA7_9ZZZZ
MEASAPLLEVKGLRVDFRLKRNIVTAIEDISFSIDAGKTLGVVGESGCGKSVTATSILRLLPKHTAKIAAGSILFQGKDLVKLRDDEMRGIRGSKISMIFQEPMTSLNPVYTIGWQMSEMLRTHQSISARDAMEQSVEMLKKVGISAPEQRISEYPHQLSGGMRQRVMIAMAMSCNPRLLIADEPTTALDVTIQSQILDLMDGIKKTYNTAIMLVTHDMGVVAGSADQVMVMYAGQIVEYGDVADIFNHPLHPYTKGLLRSIPRLDQDSQRLYTIEGTVPPIGAMASGCRFHERCPECFAPCKAQVPPLGQIGTRKIRCWKYSAGQG